MYNIYIYQKVGQNDHKSIEIERETDKMGNSCLLLFFFVCLRILYDILYKYKEATKWGKIIIKYMPRKMKKKKEWKRTILMNNINR